MLFVAFPAVNKSLHSAGPAHSSTSSSRSDRLGLGSDRLVVELAASGSSAMAQLSSRLNDAAAAAAAGAAPAAEPVAAPVPAAASVVLGGAAGQPTAASPAKR